MQKRGRDKNTRTWPEVGTEERAADGRTLRVGAEGKKDNRGTKRGKIRVVKRIKYVVVGPCHPYF